MITEHEKLIGSAIQLKDDTSPETDTLSLINDIISGKVTLELRFSMAPDLLDLQKRLDEASIEYQMDSPRIIPIITTPEQFVRLQEISRETDKEIKVIQKLSTPETSYIFNLNEPGTNP